MRQLVDELYQERIAGAELGDIFTVGDDNILTANISTGLEKSDSKLNVKTSSTGGVEVGTNGVAAKLIASKGLYSNATGLGVTDTYIWPVGSVYFTSVATNPNTLLGYGTWVCLGSGNLTLT